MSSVPRVLLAAISGLFGIAFSIVCIKVDEALKLLPHIAAPRGEDDFAVRATLFFGVVPPSFLALGAILGWLGYREPRRALLGWLGAIIGSGTAFVLASALLPALRRIGVGDGNATFATFLAVWLGLAVAGATLLAKIGRSRATAS